MENFPREYHPQPHLESRGGPAQGQQPMATEYRATASRELTQRHDEQPVKRQKLSLEMMSRGSFDQDQRYIHRPYDDHRTPYSPYSLQSQPQQNHATQNQPLQSYGTNFAQVTYSPTVTVPEYSFRHQRTESSSSSTSPPYISPHPDIQGTQSSIVSQPYPSPHSQTGITSHPPAVHLPPLVRSTRRF